MILGLGEQLMLASGDLDNRRNACINLGYTACYDSDGRIRRVTRSPG